MTCATVYKLVISNRESHKMSENLPELYHFLFLSKKSLFVQSSWEKDQKKASRDGEQKDSKISPKISAEWGWGWEAGWRKWQQRALKITIELSSGPKWALKWRNKLHLFANRQSPSGKLKWQVGIQWFAFRRTVVTDCSLPPVFWLFTILLWFQTGLLWSCAI